MTVKIEGKIIFYSAIEAMWYDNETSNLVVRTVSGMEINKPVSSEQQAMGYIDDIIVAVSIVESV